MEIVGPVVAVAILAVVIAIVVRIVRAPGSTEMAQRAGRLVGSPASRPARQPTLDDLRPGDAVSFWDGDDEVVEAVVECREELGGRTSTWRWVVLSGGRVLEVAPDESALYIAETVYRQGTAPFYALTADPDEGGALKLFEERVRDRSIARAPVTVELDGVVWTVESTGTFMASYRGAPPRREVWRDISTNPSDNVYFELHRDDGAMALGLWTTHIAVLEGRPLNDTDIQNLYPGDLEEVRS